MYIVRWATQEPSTLPYFVDGQKYTLQWTDKLSKAKLFSSKEEAIKAVYNHDSYWVKSNLIVVQYMHPLNIHYADAE